MSKEWMGHIISQCWLVQERNEVGSSPKSALTKRALDAGDSAAFSSVFLASSFLCSQTESTLPPTAANASRWAFPYVSYGVLIMLTPHPLSNIEYWFFKVNNGPVALIVDWIERRKSKEHVLRVSVHSPYKREVIFEGLESFMPSDNFLSQKKTTGHAGDVSWDLDIELGSEQIKPDIFPAGLLRMPDTLYKSAPLAKFTGWIRHGNEKIFLDRVYGAVT
jgi:hypothetical protein